MKDNLHETEKELNVLKDVPARNALKARSGRSQFSRQAEQMRRSSLNHSRTSRWWHLPNNWQEVHTMKLSMKITSILVVIALLLGGAGLTAVAAQTSLPGEVFYPLKMLTEDIQLGTTTNNAELVNFSLEFANRRYTEIQQLLEDGLMPPDPVVVRWQNHVLSALQNAIEADEPLELLETVKTTLQQQFKMMSKLELGPTTEPWMNQFQNQIKNQIGLVEAGIEDPSELAKELQWLFQYKQQLAAAGEGDQWQWMFQHQNQSLETELQYQWQYQYQQSEEIPGAGQNRTNQNQENNQNNPADNGGENPQNNENEQNGDGGNNGNQGGSQDSGGNGNNGGSGGGGNGGK